jgi:hypothetical protein
MTTGQTTPLPTIRRPIQPTDQPGHGRPGLHSCDCDPDADHQDGCPLLQVAHRRGLYRLLRELAALLSWWPEGHDLRQVARDLTAGPTTSSDSGCLIKAGQLLWLGSEDAHLRTLGESLIVLGSDLALERPASTARMRRLWDARHAAWAFSVGCAPADLSEHADLIPASQRLGWLEAATGTITRFRHDGTSTRSLAGDVLLLHEAAQDVQETGQRTPGRLSRADQDTNETLAASMITAAGHQFRAICPDDPSVPDEAFEPGTFTRLDEAVSRLIAAAFLVRLEAPYWRCEDLDQGLSLLRHAHAALARLARAALARPHRPQPPEAAVHTRGAA